jgi:hypothetical protein
MSTREALDILTAWMDEALIVGDYQRFINMQLKVDAIKVAEARLH